MKRKQLRVAVVCGGVSTEREISLKSGEAIYNALREYGYENITLFDLKADNLHELLAMDIDVAFLALHGMGGEDGCIQGALRLAGIPFTGPNVEASAVCMNKILTKFVLKENDLPTAEFRIINREDYGEASKKRIADEIGFPMVVKSPCQGSSIGVVIVKSQDEMDNAAKEIFKYGNRMLAEQFIDGTELTLPIIGNDELTVLPDIEITSEREFYDYKAKYTNGLCHHIIPSRISDDVRSKVREIGEKAYRTLGCRGISRIDFIADKEGNPYIIEVNTIPGMTAMSLVPDSARYYGMSFGELADKIVGFALEK